MSGPLAVLLVVRVLIATPERGEVRDGLVESLQIQLAETATVESGGPLAGSTLPERVRAAVALAHERDAALVVWIDESTDTGGGLEHVLHVVGGGGERALIEIARFSREESDVDRMLALSVGTLLDRVLSSSSLEAGLADVSGDRASRFGIRIEAGGVGVAGRPGVSGGLEVGVGPRFRLDGLDLELLGIARLLAEVDEREAAGRVTVGEWSAAIALRALLRAGRFAGGLALLGGLRFVDADGRAPDGRQGHDDRALGTLGAMLEGRYDLARGVALRLAAGVDVSPRRQAFTLDGEPVLDLGRVRGCLTLSLSLNAP